MHLPVGLDPGQGTAPASISSGCAADWRPRTGRPTPAARLAALEPPAGRLAPGPAWRPLGAVRRPPRAHGRVRPGSRPPGDRAGGGGGGRPRRPPAPAGRRGRGLGEPRRRPDLDAPGRRPADQRRRGARLRPRGPGGGVRRHRSGRGPGRFGVGLLRSDDGGATWRALVARELLGAGVHDLLVDAGDAGRLLAATTAGLGRRPTAGAVGAAAGRAVLVHRRRGRRRAARPGRVRTAPVGGRGASWRRVPLAPAPGASTGWRSPSPPAAG